MAHRQLIMFSSLILAITILRAGGAAAQSSNCTNVLISMSPCLNSMSGNSSAPSAACCTQLGSVARLQPQCLCQVVNGGGSNLGLNINQSQAQALPKACNVQTPPPSQCTAASPSGGSSGSKTVPSGNNGSSDANSIRMTVSLLFFLLFTTSYVSAFNTA